MGFYFVIGVMTACGCTVANNDRRHGVSLSMQRRLDPSQRISERAIEPKARKNDKNLPVSPYFTITASISRLNLLKNFISG
jgi:hypothetical protein